MAPHFKEGETDPADWTAQLAHPAPWGEIGTSKMVAAAPRSSLLGVDDPTAVAEYYNRALDACAWLASIPAERTYPQRIQTDVDIGGGYMHSGYPIMAQMDVADANVQLPFGWGQVHELGHNHQKSAWTWDCLGEVSTNW